MTDDTAKTTEESPPAGENFAALLEEAYGTGANLERTVIPGTVIAIEGDIAVIDVGLKSEGRVPLKEFSLPGQSVEINVGDTVEVYLERMENRNGEAALSREKARREEAWTMLEKAFADNDRVDGIIFGRVKGGFTVDFSGAIAFLPGSQVDVRPVRDIGPLMGSPQPFQILKMDRRRGNMVVSRRAVLAETRAEARAGLVASLKEGQVIDGVVKNITDYGAFVDLGGIDGLLHVTDMAWRRVNHPTEVLNIGETVKVQILRVNPETQRISLGMKQLAQDPWEDVEGKYPLNATFTGRVTNITDYGAFVELEPGVEGLAHISEMSWTKKNVHPGKIISTSQEVEVMVLGVDSVKRRISLSVKKCTENPWESFGDEHAPGTTVKGDIKSITEFGLFIGVGPGIDGMVHMSDIDWTKPSEEAISAYNKGDTVEAKVLDVDVGKERISLGIKQLTDDPFQSLAEIKKGDTVTCAVAAVRDNGIEVTVGGDLPGFIRRADLARDRSEQRPDRFAVGDKVDAKVSNIDRDAHKLTLSIKALEIADEKQAMDQYGSTDSGASLGDILGAAINRSREQLDQDSEPEAGDGGPGDGAEAEAAEQDGADAASGDAGTSAKSADEAAPAEAEPADEAADTASDDAPEADSSEDSDESADGTERKDA